MTAGWFAHNRLIAGRECGPCVACCQFIGIDDEQLEKPSNVLCVHCAPPHGCSVYAVRPPPCSGWFCGWRCTGGLADHWRPDLSGIVLRPEGIENNSMTFTVLDPNKIFQTIEFANFVAFIARQNISILLQVLGPPGHFPALCPMDNHIAGPLTANDYTEVLRQFHAAYNHVRANMTWEPDGLAMRSALAKTE